VHSLFVSAQCLRWMVHTWQVTGEIVNVSRGHGGDTGTTGCNARAFSTGLHSGAAEQLRARCKLAARSYQEVLPKPASRYAAWIRRNGRSLGNWGEPWHPLGLFRPWSQHWRAVPPLLVTPHLRSCRADSRRSDKRSARSGLPLWAAMRISKPGHCQLPILNPLISCPLRCARLYKTKGKKMPVSFTIVLIALIVLIVVHLSHVSAAHAGTTPSTSLQVGSWDLMSAHLSLSADPSLHVAC